MKHRIIADSGEPPRIDVNQPSPARIYDYYLGGKDYFAADKEAAEEALSVVPHGRQVARANRKFLVRAVKHMASLGIEQFIDLGTGIPTSPNVHEVAGLGARTPRVIYVDNDPIVAAHSQAILANEGRGIAAIRGDVRYPENILRNDTLRRIIDFSRPVGILFVAVLHFVTDADDPYAAVALFRDQVPSGSYLALSHITSDGTPPEVISTIEQVYARASAPAVFRTRDQISRFFDGYRLIQPGLVEVAQWRGNSRKPQNPLALHFLCGVGRKP
jgi:S-adenosyl methyltransferase